MDTLLSALRAVGEVTRLRILALLGRGELTVGELVQILDQSQPRVSRHLKLMGEAGVLDRFQEGTQVFYRLASDGNAAALNRALLPLVPGDDAVVKSDREKLLSIRAERAEEAQAYFRKHAAEWDQIRSLYVSEDEVEQALLDVQGRLSVERLLDVGTGTGRMLDVFSPYVGQAVGLDVSRDMLSVARANLADKDLINCQVRLGDMYDLGVQPSSQDLVIFHQVLHFAEDPGAAIEQAATALAPGGQLLIADFAPHQEEYLRDEQAHRRLGFSDEEITEMGESFGLLPVQVRHLDGGTLRVTIWRFDKAPA